MTLHFVEQAVFAFAQTGNRNASSYILSIGLKVLFDPDQSNLCPILGECKLVF